MGYDGRASLPLYPFLYLWRLAVTIYLSTDNYLIADTKAELRKFARLLGIVNNDPPGLLRLRQEEATKARLLGATEIAPRELAAMNSLQMMGHDMGCPTTAPARRSALARQYMTDDR